MSAANRYAAPAYVVCPTHRVYFSCANLKDANRLASDLIGAGEDAFVADDLGFLSSDTDVEPSPLSDLPKIQKSVKPEALQLTLEGR